MTFGLVLALWYSEIKRNLKNLKQALNVINVGQISGAIGTFAHSPLELEE
jgi:adenylosuccinate lyase